MKGKKWAIVGAILAISLLVACAPAPAPTVTVTVTPTAPAPKPAPAPVTKVLNVATLSDVGSIAYASIVEASVGIKKTTGIDIKAVSIPGDVAAMSALKDGTVDCIMPGSATTQTAWDAIGKFGEAGWAPLKDIRQVWTIRWTDVGIGVKATSDIYTLEDLKGKRMAIVPTSDAYTLAAEALCAWIQADYDADFDQVVSASYSGAIKYVKDGSADFALSGTSAANAYETEASPGGLRWLQMNPGDKEGWKRWTDSWPIPGYGPMFVPEGQGAAIPEGGSWGFGSPYTWITLKDNLDAETAYQLAKGFSMGYQYFWDAHPHLWQSSMANNIRTDFITRRIPLHEGVVNWFAEIGAWTPVQKAEQAKRLADAGSDK